MIIHISYQPIQMIGPNSLSEWIRTTVHTLGTDYIISHQLPLTIYDIQAIFEKHKDSTHLSVWDIHDHNGVQYRITASTSF